MDLDGLGVKSKNFGRNTVAKSLLRNVIRHTDTHNRHLEESEMWNLHGKIKRDEEARSRKERKGTYSDEKHCEDKDVQNSFLYDDREEVPWSRKGRKQAHMDDIADKSSGQSTYWMRQLHSFEEADPDRWGHSGFKELYPEVYNSDRSDPDISKSDSKKKKKKRKKEKLPKRKEKKRKEKSPGSKSKKHKSRRKTSLSLESSKRTRNNSESDSGGRKVKHFKASGNDRDRKCSEDSDSRCGKQKRNGENFDSRKGNPSEDPWVKRRKRKLFRDSECDSDRRQRKHSDDSSDSYSARVVDSKHHQIKKRFSKVENEKDKASDSDS